VNVPSQELQKGLKQRHLTMIAIGGVIGAGLFVGSGIVIGDTGPGAFLTYAITGVVIVMVMRMLGEMATANPSTGSFSDYSRQALGGWAGFSVAWLYWYFWVVVVGFEAVAGAKVLQFWIPDVPLWVMSLVLMTLMTATNLFSVTSFGEFEYWFASIKVVAIIAFLILGTLFVFGILGDRGVDFSNLTDHGGFFPEGKGAIFSGIVVVIFSMVGAEIATIAAAESKDPARAVAKATNSVIMRIGIFFVGSLFLLAVMLPWNSADLEASPFVSAFKLIGIPGVDHVMNAVVLTAVLSCLNSGLYTASRMLFVLAARREAPQLLLRVSSKGVPAWAILTSTVIGFLCVIAAFVSPEKVFLFLLNSSGAIILFVYLLICVSQLILRRRTPKDRLIVKMWGFPVITLLTIAAIVGVLISMGVNSDTRTQLELSLLAWAVFLVLYAVMQWRNRLAGVPVPATETGPVQRVLVVANQTLGAVELMQEVRRIHGSMNAHYLVCVPVNAVAMGQTPPDRAAHGLEATRQAAADRLDETLSILASEGLRAEGRLGDSRPLVAMDEAVKEFHPDSIIISTHPHERSAWLREGVVAKAEASYKIPVHHVVSHAPEVFAGV
jgi:GABA permease